MAKRGNLRALDATYDFNTYALYSKFGASSPGTLCIQVFGQQFGTVRMDGAYIGNS